MEPGRGGWGRLLTTRDVMKFRRVTESWIQSTEESQTSAGEPCTGENGEARQGPPGAQTGAKGAATLLQPAGGGEGAGGL